MCSVLCIWAWPSADARQCVSRSFSPRRSFAATCVRGGADNPDDGGFLRNMFGQPPPPPPPQLGRPPPPPEEGFEYPPPLYEDEGESSLGNGNEMEEALGNSTSSNEQWQAKEPEEVYNPYYGYGLAPPQHDTQADYPPYYYPPDQQQQQQQQQPYDPNDYVANLQYSLQDLQSQLEQSRDELHNATQTCQRYQTLYTALKAEQELHEEEMRLGSIQHSQMELNLMELKEHCDSLESVKRELTGQVSQLQDQCLHYQQHASNLTAELDQLQETHKTTLAELEQLAIAIETSRIDLETQRREETTRLKRREQMLRAKQARDQPKSFLSTLWSYFFPDSDLSTLDSDSDYEDDDNEDPKGHKLAQKTLLVALQQTREEVAELETTVEVLQLNCTSLQDRLDSKVELIDELHDRIAVFEEDKVVLKAALKQLRKEMRVEETKRLELQTNYTQLEKGKFEQILFLLLKPCRKP